MPDFHISPELMRQLEQDRQAIARELPELQVRNARMCKAAAEETLSGHLRRAIHASARPIRAIADESGIDSDTLCDFLEGTQTLPSDVLDRLTQAVGVAVSFSR
jgi:hypothetical protein